MTKRVYKYILLKKAIKIMRRNEGTFNCFQLWVCDAFSEQRLPQLSKAIEEYERNRSGNGGLHFSFKQLDDYANNQN